MRGRRIPAVVCDADQQVRARVAAAEAEACRIRDEAEVLRERVLAEARQLGRREGLARAAAVLAAAEATRARRLREAEREIVAIALEVARRILGREIAERGGVVDLAAGAVAEARERREVTLRVNPADASTLHDAQGRLASLLVRASLVLREDPTVAPGAAVVETEAGRIDASIETQLSHLSRALEEVLP